MIYKVAYLNNKIPWALSKAMKFIKYTTLGHEITKDFVKSSITQNIELDNLTLSKQNAVIMGFKTLQYSSFMTLNHGQNYVLTRDI